MRNFLKDEGALLTVTANARGESGTLFGGGAPRTGDPTKNLPQVAITAENYNRIARLAGAQRSGEAARSISRPSSTPRHRFVQRDRRNSRQRPSRTKW